MNNATLTRSIAALAYVCALNAEFSTRAAGQTVALIIDEALHTGIGLEDLHENK